MARKRPGFYDTIEYIGPRPQKPKKPNVFGGWVILVIAAGIAFWFGRPLIPFVRAAQSGASLEEASLLISSLEHSGVPGERLAAAALAHSSAPVSFDSSYYKIDYPNGDIPFNKGKAEDVLIRCFRQIGVDLQKEVHEDMAENFRLYPQLWQSAGPDPNIDHRRVLNLQRFFTRKGLELPVSRNASDYEPGDIVVWSLANGDLHTGIVVPGPSGYGTQPWVVHNLNSGVKWENILFEYQIIGRYRYPAQ